MNKSIEAIKKRSVSIILWEQLIAYAIRKFFDEI